MRAAKQSKSMKLQLKTNDLSLVRQVKNLNQYLDAVDAANAAFAAVEEEAIASPTLVDEAIRQAYKSLEALDEICLQAVKDNIPVVLDWTYKGVMCTTWLHHIENALKN